MKHRIVHTLQKYLLNPPIKLLFAVGVAPPGHALLETTGRTTGRRAALQLATRASAITSETWQSMA